LFRILSPTTTTAIIIFHQPHHTKVLFYFCNNNKCNKCKNKYNNSSNKYNNNSNKYDLIPYILIFLDNSNHGRIRGRGGRVDRGCGRIERGRVGRRRLGTGPADRPVRSSF
jgi:hypothetical protein